MVRMRTRANWWRGDERQLLTFPWHRHVNQHVRKFGTCVQSRLWILIRPLHFLAAASAPDMLPLSMLHELNDICFFVKSLKQAFISFTITDYVSFSGNNTRSGSHHKLVQPMATTTRLKHFYFNRLPHLWNSLPPSYRYIKKLIKSRTFSGNTSSLTLTHPIPVPITSVAHAPNVWLLPNQLLSSSFMLPNHHFWIALQPS